MSVQRVKLFSSCTSRSLSTYLFLNVERICWCKTFTNLDFYQVEAYLNWIPAGLKGFVTFRHMRVVCSKADDQWVTDVEPENSCDPGEEYSKQTLSAGKGVEMSYAGMLSCFRDVSFFFLFFFVGYSVKTHCSMIPLSSQTWRGTQREHFPMTTVNTWKQEEHKTLSSGWKTQKEMGECLTFFFKVILTVNGFVT